MDGDKELDPENTRSVVNTVLDTINNAFEHECLADPVRLLNAHPIGQSIDDHVPGHNYSIPGLPGTKFLAYHLWGIRFIVRRWDSDTDILVVLVADEMGLGKTFTSVAPTMISRLPN